MMEVNGRKLKVGIIGLGKMGLLHASILNTLPSVELAALCDKSAIMRRFAKNALKRPIVTDKMDELAKLGLDVVYVTTPIPSHYGVIKDVYGSIAKNVFTEKTLSANPAFSQELCDIAKKYGGSNMVGYMKRFSVTFKKAKELLDQGLLGNLLNFDAYAYSSDFAEAKDDGASNSRGGVLEDLGSHVVDLSLWYFEDLFSAYDVSSQECTLSDVVQFAVTGSTGFTGKFSISWAQRDYRMPEFGLTIHGTEGTLDVSDSAVILARNRKEPLAYFRQDLDDHVGFYLGDSEYYREDKIFIQSVDDKSYPEPSFQTARKVDVLLEQVRMRRR